MKRFVIIFIALLLLAACQPTPEQDYIVNRAEEHAPAEIEASAQAVEPISVPAHATDKQDPTEHVTVIVDADVEFDPSAAHPLIEVDPLNVTQNDAVVSALLKTAGSGAALYEAWPETKDEVGALLRAALQYDGSLGSLVALDKQTIDDLERRYQNAPESPEKIRADRLETGKNYYLERSDGEIFRLNVNFEPNSLYYARGTEFTEEYYPASFLDDCLDSGSTVTLAEPKMSEADAQKITEAFMQALGVECDCLLKTERGFSMRCYAIEETFWVFSFVRSIGGTPSIDRPGSFMTGLDTPSSIGAPWNVESATVYVGTDGVVCANLWGLAKAAQVTVKNAQLCAFEKVLDAGIRQIGYLHDGAMNRPHHTYTVTNVKLRYGMQAKKDNISAGVYQPMWEFTYTDVDSPDEKPKSLYISALSGGYVEPRCTVKSLMRYAD